MAENLRIIVRVRYIQDEKLRICYGEIQKTIMEEIHEDNNPSILIENDMNMTLVKKQSILAIDELGTSSVPFEKITHADGKISIYST